MMFGLKHIGNILTFVALCLAGMDTVDHLLVKEVVSEEVVETIEDKPHEHDVLVLEYPKVLVDVLSQCDEEKE